MEHGYLQNLDGNPSLITSMNGGNFAVNGDGAVQFNVVSGGSQGINANQYASATPTVTTQTSSGDPKLVTSFNGGNFAINGNANVKFNVANGGSQGINANQYEGTPVTMIQPVVIRQQPVIQQQPVVQQQVDPVKQAMEHGYLVNLNGDPSLITSFNGGNYAINGSGNVSFNIANGGSQGINANQYKSLLIL